MSPTCRPGTAAVAALVIGVAIALALRGIAQTQVPGGSTDGDSPLLGARLRVWYRALLSPLENLLVEWHVHADMLTYSQLVVSVLAGAAFWQGCIFLGGWLTILAGTLDVLDGGVARQGGTSGPRGALVDSLTDRYAEFATFFGLGAFFRDDWALGVVAFACFGSLMVSYTRARAEGLGLDMKMGSVQRPERYVILGFGGWVDGLAVHLTCPLLGRPTHVVLKTAVVALAALSTWTALRRARHAARGLSEAAG